MGRWIGWVQPVDTGIITNFDFELKRQIIADEVAYGDC